MRWATQLKAAVSAMRKAGRQRRKLKSQEKEVSQGSFLSSSIFFLE
jgi:hypothetical protein